MLFGSLGLPILWGYRRAEERALEVGILRARYVHLEQGYGCHGTRGGGGQDRFPLRGNDLLVSSSIVIYIYIYT